MFNNLAHEYEFLDMHGLTKVMCIKTLKEKLNDIQSELDRSKLKPNHGDSHVFHVITGAGNHSQGRAVLKYAVDSWLQAQGFDYYPDITHGQFLVRLSKR